MKTEKQNIKIQAAVMIKNSQISFIYPFILIGQGRQRGRKMVATSIPFETNYGWYCKSVKYYYSCALNICAAASHFEQDGKKERFSLGHSSAGYVKLPEVI